MAATSVFGGESGTVSPEWRVWLEPRFMHAPVSSPVPGAKKTEFAGGKLDSDELQTFTSAQFQELGLEWNAFFQQARQNAAADLAGLKPEYSRNRKTKVIEYATLRADKPILASAVLAPKFLELFQETLGPKVFVVVPNRSVAFVFPALASSYQEYAPMILNAYRETAFPVSKEVFEFSADGIRAIGQYEEP